MIITLLACYLVILLYPHNKTLYLCNGRRTAPKIHILLFQFWDILLNPLKNFDGVGSVCAKYDYDELLGSSEGAAELHISWYQSH